MLDLALHYGQGGRGLTAIQDVARRQGIPQRYLEQVLLLLKRAGFLGSRRGSAGGYQLVRPPAEISVGDVLRAIEGTLTPIEAGRRNARADGDGGDLQELWSEVTAAMSGVLDRTSFGDLAERAAARRDPARPMYHI